LTVVDIDGSPYRSRGGERATVVRVHLRPVGASPETEVNARGRIGLQTGEAPSIYEMEGASKSSGFHGPIARPADPAEPVTIAW
jgi:hypothetical protein